jgi:uncharacterized membrane protein
MGQMQYLPLAAPFFAILVGVFVLLVILIEINVLRYAYTRLGVSSGTALLLLFASLIGSYVNIPVWEFPESSVRSGQEVVYFGVHYIIPVVEEWPRTVIAVNVGGALIPIALSLYLLAKNDLWGAGLITTAVVTVLVHLLAEPVQGVGIAVPIFVPPVVTALTALLIARHHAAAIAYAGGSLGTLIGADLLNLGVVRGLGAPVASIGGAGTFDGIFLTGIVAVLLASFSRRA